MGWTIIWHELTLAPMILYLGSIFWVIGYDTIYAHQDREDDALVGVKSTARLFGKKTKMAISFLYSGAIMFFALAFWLTIPLTQVMAAPAWLGLLIGSVHMVWQVIRLDINNAEQCLRLFQSNNTFGLILFAGLFASLLFIP